MNNWVSNGLTIGLTAAFLVAGFFGMDVAKALMPTEEGQIVSVKTAPQTSLLNVDAQEDLTFYPWTLYREEETVAATSEADDAATWDDFCQTLDSWISDVCASWNPDIVPKQSEKLTQKMRHQQSLAKYFLPDQPYTGHDNKRYKLNLVWDGMSIEAMHVTPADGSQELSNDQRMQATNRLKKAIYANRRKQSPLYEIDYAGRATAAENDDALTKADQMLLDEWLMFFKSIVYRDHQSPDFTDQVLPYLLYESNYNMVFYEGEILLFFLPDSAAMVPLSNEKMTGLLLYINPQSNALNGFQILNLIA